MDSHDKLLLAGFGINDHHEKKVADKLFGKRFLPSFNSDNTQGAKYHYTSPEGLRGILQTRTFYFTDSQFLNDFREKININEELDLFWKLNYQKYDSRFADLICKDRVTQYEDSGFSYIDKHTEQICRYFVLSLSTEGDSLSMWKYYTKTANYDGYCIRVFSTALIDEWIDRITGAAAIASQVEYYSRDKQAIISTIVDRLYSIWTSYQLSSALDEKIKKEFISWISVKALFFKDECFEDEHETRYVAVVPVDQLNGLHYVYNEQTYKMYDFRFVNGVLTPFIRMPFNDWNKDTCWAIDSIRIGPSGNAEQKEAGLRQFIHSLDYKFDQCSILHSNIPVRY